MVREYALLSYRTSDGANIGDDIQSLASRRFLPSVDYLVDRQSLDDFRPAGARSVGMILNGWFFDTPHNWPPSDRIWPLLISMHINDQTWIALKRPIKDFILSGPFLKYFQVFGPVGARDEHTLHILESAGIDSYLSGCMTLTLNRPADVCETDAIVLCDVPEFVVQHVKLNTKRRVITTSHFSIETDRTKKLAEAERLLALYAGAHCVITTRLHCALPSLAMSTPVLLLDPDGDPTRFSDLKHFLHHCGSQEFVAGTFSYDMERPPANKEGHLVYRDALIARVGRFISFTADCNIDPVYPITTSDRLAAMTTLYTYSTKAFEDERRQRLSLLDTGEKTL